jgi:hypothetical protein
VPLDVHFELLSEAKQEETCHPDFVCSALGTFSKYLEFPLAFCHFSIDAFVIDSGVEAEIQVDVCNLASNSSDVFVSDTAVVFTLWVGVAAFGETERHAVFHHEILLFKTEPSAWVVSNAGTGVGGVWGSVGKHDFTHDEHTILTSAVRVASNWFEHTIGVAAVCLLGGGAIEAPVRKLVNGGEFIEFLHHTLSAEVLDGLIAVKPYVIESVFSHSLSFCLVVS